MPNKKINQLDLRTAVSTDLMLVGDPTNGTAYKSTLANLPLVPTSRTLTINGVAFDLSANRNWTIDTLPSQTGNAGKYLTTNGTAASWGTIDLSGYVPYTGATSAVNLGAYDLTVNELTIGKGLNGVANNTALGKRALFHTTTGNYNTAVGHEAGHNLTTGQYNTAIGQSAMFTATSAAQNVAIGLNALLYTTSGGSNVVVGLDGMQHNTTGSSNTAIGYNAGSHITGGATPNTTASNSVFIGRDSKAAADGQTNQIVIGQNAVGNGSNTATFGNTATTANYFTGSINGGSFNKSGGTSAQFLKADGSVDSSAYITGITSGNVTTALGYTPVNPTRSISTTSPLVGGGDLSADRTLSIPAATTSVNGYLTSTDWNTFAGKQAALTLTTTGTSGAATLVGATLNIPQYSGTNIYNASGSLTSARALTLNAFNLDFIGSVHTSRITAAGRFLLGTTSESTFILDVNGTARVSSFTDIGSGTDSTANPNSYIFKVWGSQRITGDIQLTGAAGSGRVIEFSNGIVKISPTTYSGGGTSSVSIQGFASGNAAIGIGGTASNTQSIAIGNASLASGIYGVAIGSGTLASGTSSVAIGVSSSAEAGEFVCGYPYDIGVTNVYFGSGKIRKAGSTTVNGAGISYAINGSGAAGTDFAGGNITIAGGKGTGTGTSGDVIISTATPTTTGTILQSLTSRWWVKVLLVLCQMLHLLTHLHNSKLIQQHKAFFHQG
jgi:hypothetical protein